MIRNSSAKELIARRFFDSQINERAARIERSEIRERRERPDR
jgi:hypothetical protein